MRRHSLPVGELATTRAGDNALLFRNTVQLYVLVFSQCSTHVQGAERADYTR